MLAYLLRASSIFYRNENIKEIPKPGVIFFYRVEGHEHCRLVKSQMQLVNSFDGIVILYAFLHARDGCLESANWPKFQAFAVLHYQNQN